MTSEASSTGRGTILIVNGPNLNLLGTREPGIYGHATLVNLQDLVAVAARGHGFDADFIQSNHEGALVDAIHAARDSAVGIVINAGAYTHTSIAIRDALAGVGLPAVEVHISNVHRREEFRHFSYLSAVVDAVIVGAGMHGYELAISYLAKALAR
ncbi:MAG: type II 3-dehydroquinate dehydratase [Actinomycetota bacterium]|uniref:type II 3-dehydroquinate dehydratase n=1 Tax=Paenarthrobacter sp. PH39-S1 TaxID=3046204 RepID=UPI0024BB33DB|nr:type II 3-dehydroquinate dehydratase [Paenarthrobacter sp. PH39-S1]MDJ0355179.1 type II 3-dehydroquinate dehydratase [Paenarthrobacter sp. PH39-S1]MDQ6740796.1 type II 3-dehydroquinate dehydratase [Actinomycetota bacterium]